LRLAGHSPCRKSSDRGRATTSSGNAAELLSFGAVDVRLSDPAGHRLHLRPGMMADVVVPAFTLDPATAPATIATWSYDENTGFWREEAQATPKPCLFSLALQNK
jgi:hypothetical protein